MKVFIFFLSLIGLSQAVVQLSSVLTFSEQNKIKLVLEDTKFTDISHAYYAIHGLKSLSQGGAVQSAVQKGACDAVKAANTKSLESVFYISATISALGASCKYELPAAAVDSVGKKIAEDSDVKSIYYAVSLLSNVGKKFSSDDVVKSLVAALKKDDSVYASSLALLTATKLDSKTDLKSLLAVADIEDMVAQADEIDEKYLHFENDLRTTSTFIRAAFEFAEKTGKPLGINEEQMIMLANFILRYKSPSTFEQAYNVVSSLGAFASYKPLKVTKVQLVSGTSVSQDNSVVKFSVTNVFSHPIDGITVKADSVSRSSDNEVIISNLPLKKSVAASVTSYDLDLWAKKPKSGFYDITLNVVATGGAALAGTTDIEFKVKVTTKVAVVDVKIGTQDRESTAGDMKSVQYPAQANNFKADSTHKLVMTFKIQDTMDKSFIKPHQVFVLLQNTKTNQEVIFIAEPDATSLYKFEVDLHAAEKEQFGSESGKYSVQLIVGDAAISNPVLWNVGEVSLAFTSAAPSSEAETSIYKAKPEIQHKFRVSEKRPPSVISTVFTAACLAPLVVLLLAWARTGANLSNLSLAPKNVIFHAGLAGIFFLYYMFWIRFNMFETVRYLLLIGAITFLAGNKVLSGQSGQ